MSPTELPRKATAAPSLEPPIPNKCDECGSNDILEDWTEGNATCRGCGLVVQDRLIDVSSEWRNFSDDNGPDKSRVSRPANPLVGNSTGTSIARMKPSTKDRGIKKVEHQTYRATISSKDRLMNKAMNDIDEFGERMNAPGASRNRAKELFAKYYDAKTHKSFGRRNSSFASKTLDTIYAACLFISCREVGANRTYRETAAICSVRMRDLGRMVKIIELAVPSAIVKPRTVGYDKDAVMRLCARMGFDRMFSLSVAELADTLSKTVLASSFPKTVAGTAMYVKARQNGKLNGELIAEILAIMEMTHTTLMARANTVYETMPGVVSNQNGVEKSTATRVYKAKTDQSAVESVENATSEAMHELDQKQGSIGSKSSGDEPETELVDGVFKK